MSAIMNQLTTKIVAELRDNLTEISTEKIYDYCNSAPTGYPMVRVFPTNGTGEFADQARNKRVYNMRIEVVQERTEKGDKEAEYKLWTTLDEILDLFDSRNQLDLDGLVDFCQPLDWSWSYHSDVLPEVISLVINIECVKVS